MSRAPRGADPTSIRHWNECAVIDVLRHRGVQRISDLREATGITAGPLGHVLRGLEQKRWVRSKRGEITGPGRPAQLYELTRPRGATLGVALNPAQIQASRCDLHGTVTRRLSRSFDASRGHDAVCDQIIDIVKEIMEDAPSNALWAATFAIDADIDRDGMIIGAERFPELIGCRLLERLQHLLPVPMDVVSRVNALLTIELTSGAAVDVNDVLLVDPREATSIAAAAAGRPLRGAHRVYSSLPMPFVRPPGDPCPVDDTSTGPRVALEQEIREWSQSLAMVIGVLDPQAVVVRSVPTEILEPVLEMLRRELETHLRDVPELRASTLGAEAIADGAALLTQRQVQETMISADYGAVPLSRDQFFMRAAPVED